MDGHEKRLHIGEDKKHEIAAFLLQKCLGGKIQKGALLEANQKFGVSSSTVSRVWRDAQQNLKQGKAVSFINKKVGCIHKDRYEMDGDKVANMHLKDRTTIRKMSKKLGVGKTLLHKWIKMGLLKPHTSAIKPSLTDLNKLTRLSFSLSQLHVENSESSTLDFEGMYNTVHIDEKWFYLTRTVDRYYLLPAETEPQRACKSKRFIPKVMFMCAVARPQKGRDGEPNFDGKLGIFPFITREAALYNSKHRTKGTIVTKAMQSITREEIKKCLIDKVIPAIKEKWPKWGSKKIIIQQDNARPHIAPNDADFQRVANADGFEIKLLCQPPNSPDTNINDLGFFRAIQSLQYVKPARNVDDLLNNVASSYEELDATTLNNVFLTLQGVHSEIMKVKGGNNYKIPHMGKGRLIRAGILPESLSVEKELVRECLEYLNLPENQLGESYDIDALKEMMGMN